MISFAIVAVMTTLTGCHAEKACATPCAAPVAVCAPAPVAECAPVAKKCGGLKLGGLFHHKKVACAPVACEPAPVAECAPVAKKCGGLKLGGLFHHKKAAAACAPAPVACETVVYAAPAVVASPQASAQH